MRSSFLMPMLVAGLGCAADNGHHLSESFDARPKPDARIKVPDGGAFDAIPTDGAVLYDANVSEPGPDEAHVTKPEAGAVLVGANFELECHAVPDKVTHSAIVKVVFNILDTEGRLIRLEGTATSSTEWTVAASLRDFANGKVTIQCVVAAADGSQSASQIDTFLDLGPTIDVTSPKSNDAVSGNLNVDFHVLAAPIDGDDPMSAVETVKAFVAGVEIPIEAVEPGRFAVAVLTADPLLFHPALDGETSFRVEARNKRGVVRQLTTLFIVDTEGPVIQIDSPVGGELIGGIVHLHVLVTDGVGVVPSSVIAVFANGDTKLAEVSLEEIAPSEYVGTYDTRELRLMVERVYGDTIQVVFPTLSVRARDKAGNYSSFGEEVVLDYTPPLVALDSPPLREKTFDSNIGKFVCAWEFDPLGDDSTIDLQSVAQLSEFRARVEDRGNFGLSTSDTFVPLAGVNPTKVQLFILDNTDESVGIGDALLADTNGDGICDEVNPMLRPTSVPMSAEDALVIDLLGVKSQGISWFAPDTDYDGYPTCSPPQGPDIPSVPSPLCSLSTYLQRVIAPVFGDVPVIYGIPALTTENCVGMAFDSVANHINDGWACVVVRGEDQLGNVGFSRPLRVCIDHDRDRKDAGGNSVCPPHPTYPTNPDVTADKTEKPNVPLAPLGDPARDIDCTGTYVPANPDDASPEPHTYPDEDCTLPNAIDFPVRELRGG